jgi:uncharacterized protein YjbI with pentapeptide repeats
MLTDQTDLYLVSKAPPPLGKQIRRFIKERGIELTIAIVGLFIGAATVLVSYIVGQNQVLLQASRMTDNYFNGILDLFAHSLDENQKINQLMIARTDAILEDLNRLDKPEKIASVILFISNLKPALFHSDLSGETPRESYIYLGEINLANTTLHNLHLEKASLPHTDLRNADLSFTNLQFALLKKANLQGANLQHTNFNDANLMEANLHNATIDQATFENANLTGAIWINGIRCKKESIGHCNY